MSRLVRALGALASAILVTVSVHGSAAQASIPRGDTVDSDPAASWGWDQAFFDGFDGAAGTSSDQWHAMTGTNGATQNGQGQLDVGRLAQIRTNTGWTLPVGTQVRVTASILMPDTGSSYAAFWVQHPNGIDPREIDVIESYGPLKPWGAQLGSHICYDDTPETVVNACVASGRAPELFSVTPSFPTGIAPWQTWWEYAAEFTIGGDTTLYTATDALDNRAYELTSTPDVRRVPGNAAPFHLRLSNKAVDDQNVVPGGTRESMLVDWVGVEIKLP